MKVNRITINNFRGIVAREIVMNGSHVRLRGPNRSGKSSGALSFLYALAGKGTSQPVRVGADKAEVEIDIGDWVFKRATLADGKQEPFVGRGKAGKKLPTTPAKFVESLIGSGLALDPLAIYRMRDEDQQATILAALGVDVTAEEAETATAFARRTDVNARRKAAESRVKELRDAGADPNAPPATSARALHDKIEAVRKRCAAEDRRTVTLRAAKERYERAEAALKAAMDEVDASSAALATAQEAKADETCLADHKAAVGELETLDRRNAEATRGEQLRLGIQEAEALRIESDGLTERLDELSRTRASKIADAAKVHGIDGLGFAADKRGVTLGGVRLAELNAEQRVSLALRIVFARPQELRTAVIDEAIDNARLKELFAWGAEKDIQLIIATLEPDGDELKIEIFDGDDEVI